MKFNVLERVILGSMLVAYQGNFTTLKLVREGREALSFNEVENRKLEFVQNGTNTSWNPEASIEFQSVEIDLGEVVTSIIKTMLTELNKEEKLTEQHFSLYEKFMN